MTQRTALLAVALLLAAGAVPPAMAEDVPLPALYKSLAEKNYYPVVEGLKDAQADVKCNILDQVVAAFPDAAGKPIAVKFFWARPGEAAPQKKFSITGIPDGLTDLSNRAKQIFARPEGLVITDPVYWTIETTQAAADKTDTGITVTGTAKNASDALKKLVVKIDSATYQVKRMEMDLGQAQAGVDITSKDLGGKWGAESMVTSNPQYRETVKYEYSQVEGFWLPTKITVDYQSPDGKSLSPTFVYDLSNWQVNKGLPAGVF